MSNINTVGQVLKRPTLAIVTVIVSVGLGALFWALTFDFTPTPLPKYIQMYGISFTLTTIMMGFAIAILTGVNTALVLCRKQMTGSLGFKKSAGSSACSALTGAIASGCPVCTAPLLGVFGLGGALAFLPFQGLELKAIAIVALGVTLYYTTKNVKMACKM
ncbi:MAG: hypothetical protein KGH88_07465 [Thaumarchaeota archaeon]|nr:hypothetical protein [Nitrososphaerota archaeon]